jgi:hypothetical protein
VPTGRAAGRLTLDEVVVDADPVLRLFRYWAVGGGLFVDCCSAPSTASCWPLSVRSSAPPKSNRSRWRWL